MGALFRLPWLSRVSPHRRHCAQTSTGQFVGENACRSGPPESVRRSMALIVRAALWYQRHMQELGIDVVFVSEDLEMLEVSRLTLWTPAIEVTTAVCVWLCVVVQACGDAGVAAQTLGGFIDRLYASTIESSADHATASTLDIERGVVSELYNTLLDDLEQRQQALAEEDVVLDGMVLAAWPANPTTLTKAILAVGAMQ